MLTALLLVQGCEHPVSTPLPPAQDVEAATEPKPPVPADIVTDAQANARYSSALEAWGERISAASVRVCEWLNSASDEADYKCERSPNE